MQDSHCDASDRGHLSSYLKLPSIQKVRRYCRIKRSGTSNKLEGETIYRAVLFL